MPAASVDTRGMVWSAVRKLLFLLDAERAHHLTMRLFAWFVALPFVRRIMRRVFAPPPALAVTRFGRTWASPIGLAAGFDKDARWCHALSCLGFGGLEVGTVTAHAQPGNPMPRLFRLPLDHALLNRFGFNNAGAEAMARALVSRPRDVVVGVNLGKSKVTPNEAAAGDYLASLERVWPYADYLVVNVSSPNTQDLRRLQEKEALEALLGALVQRNRDLAREAGRAPVPLLVKLAPDLDDAQLDEIVRLALALGLDGIVATNTTVSREGLRTPPGEVAALGAGGVSGRPLKLRSRAIVARIHALSQGRLAIVGVGGVETAEDAWELLRAGACLVQVYSGFVYGGPGFVRRLHTGLAARLAATGRILDQVIGEASDAPNKDVGTDRAK